MTIDPKGEPLSGTTYGGFSGRRSAERPVAHRAPGRSRAMLIGGVAGALVLGVGFGLLMRPQLIGSKPPAAAVPSAATAPAIEPASPGAGQVPIAVNAPPAPAPIPRAPGKLQTLPPEMAAAARAQVQPQTVTVQQPAAVADADASAASAAAAPETATRAPAPRLQASFDCATARPGAEEMICSDASLATEDRRMARAYRRALGSGVDPQDLRQEQRDWVAIREDAARHSQQALADVYDQRIRELNAIGDSAPEE